VLPFYLHVLLVGACLFVVSVLCAELFLVSPQEQRLPRAARVGFGYVFQLAFFAAALKFMPIQWAWVLAVGLLVSYLVTRPAASLRAHWHAMVDAPGRYWKTFAVYVALLNVFLLPLPLGGRYGPFTEGGGDVTIYAEISKYIVDHDMPAWGLEAVLADLNAFFYQLNIPIYMPPVGFPFDPILANPPAPEFGAYRAQFQRYASLQYSPISTWTFLSVETNYPVFYGLLALQYALTILAVYEFLRPYGRVPGSLGAVFVGSSHSIASVFYNMFFLQSLALMLSALVLSAAWHARVFNASWLRTVGLCIIVSFVGYIHYVSVLLPIAISSLMWSSRMKMRVAEFASTVHGDGRTTSRKLLGNLPAVAWSALVAIWAITMSFGSLTFLVTLSRAVTGWPPLTSGSTTSVSEALTYFGQPIAPLSTRWYSFFFGFASQQHYEPLASMPTRIEQLSHVTAGSGACVLLLGLLVMLGLVVRGFQHHFYSKQPSARLIADAGAVLIYASCLVVIAFQYFLGRHSLYTQAKAAQNILIVLYAAVMLLPFAILWKFGPPTPAGKVAAFVYAVVLVAFTSTLLVPRAYFADRLARGLDRSSTLDESFFAQARRIRSSDPHSLVLFEPTTSSDVYLGNEAFFGGRMLPTRFLSLSRIWQVAPNGPIDAEPNLPASAFIQPTDVPHLWLLSAADRGDGTNTTTWRALRLRDVTRPELVLTANQYERFYRQAPRSTAPADAGVYAYLNQGSAQLMLPAHATETSITLRLRSPNAAEFDTMASAVGAWVAQQSGTPVSVSQLGDNLLALELRVPAAASPELVPLVRHAGELALNVRVDGRELGGQRDVQVAVADASVEPGAPVTVSWSGIGTPSSDDWIGLFPVGAPDEARIAFVFTNGGTSGTVELPVPEALTDGMYELRLFSHNTWQQLGVSEPFTIGRR
jgi:hypothetical protein